MKLLSHTVCFCVRTRSSLNLILMTSSWSKEWSFVSLSKSWILFTRNQKKISQKKVHLVKVLIYHSIHKYSFAVLMLLFQGHKTKPTEELANLLTSIVFIYWFFVTRVEVPRIRIYYRIVVLKQIRLFIFSMFHILRSQYAHDAVSSLKQFNCKVSTFYWRWKTTFKRRYVSFESFVFCCEWSLFFSQILCLLK